MKNKEINISIPNGYEIDMNNSSLKKGKIVFKKKENKVRNWRDLIGKRIPDSSKWIEDTGAMMKIDGKFWTSDKNVFIDEKHAKSALAMAQISQLMPYYGDAFTDEEWANNDIVKYVINRNRNHIITCILCTEYEFLAFHTKEQSENFLKHNEQLVKDYLMIE